jgi:hypothetical protein
MPSMRWSLASMFIATALVAVAAWAVKLCFAGDGRFLLAVAPLLGAAVGVLAGKVPEWIGYGIAVDVVLMVLGFFYLLFVF